MDMPDRTLSDMVEPVAFSPSLQRLRDLVPVEKDVSPDERQLSKAEVDTTAGLVDDAEVSFFNPVWSTLPGLPQAQQDRPRASADRAALVCLLGFDRLLLSFVSFLSRWCAVVVIVGRRPLRAAWLR